MGEDHVRTIVPLRVAYSRRSSGQVFLAHIVDRNGRAVAQMSGGGQTDDSQRPLPEWTDDLAEAMVEAFNAYFDAVARPRDG